MKAVIFDIDGTLADNSERQKYLSELRWDMFLMKWEMIILLKKF